MSESLKDTKRNKGCFTTETARAAKAKSGWSKGPMVLSRRALELRKQWDKENGR